MRQLEETSRAYSHDMAKVRSPAHSIVVQEVAD